MKRQRTGGSYADIEREERRLALECFRAGKMTQGEIHFENAIVFARCDAAEMAEKALKHQ